MAFLNMKFVGCSARDSPSSNLLFGSFTLPDVLKRCLLGGSLPLKVPPALPPLLRFLLPPPLLWPLLLLGACDK